MATYAELFDLQANDGLRNKIAVACVIAAGNIRMEDAGVANHTNRLIWAAAVFADPMREATRMMWAVLAQNAAATVAQITGAADATIQSAVNAAIDVFATGG